jgi:hypothetical protein
MNPAKLVLHFSDFSVIFYTIYKFQPKLKYYLRITLCSGPWKLQVLTKNTLAFAVRPLVLKRTSQCDPRRPVGAAPAEIRRPTALGCGGKGGGSLVAHLGVDFRARRG